MRLFKYFIASLIASGLLMGLMPTSVLADSATQNQDLDQTVTVTCTSGSYGQNSTCTSTATQSGSQRQEMIIYRRGVRPVKGLADTGLDTPTMAVVAGIFAIGSIALISKIKNRSV